jgi:hypothetical protein
MLLKLINGFTGTALVSFRKNEHLKGVEK